MSGHDVRHCPACTGARETLEREMESEPTALGAEVVLGVKHLIAVLFGDDNAVVVEPELEPGDPDPAAVGDIIGDFLEHKGYASPNHEALGKCAIAAVRHAGATG